VGDVLSEQLRVNFRRDLLCHLRDLFRRELRARQLLALRVDLPGVVRLDDVFRQSGVVIRIRAVRHREDEVEPRDERGFEVDLLADRLVLIEPTVLGVRRAEEGTPRFQRRVDPRLRDGDLLLFEPLVHRRAVRRIHFIQLVDCGDSLVSEDESAGFE